MCLKLKKLFPVKAVSLIKKECGSAVYLFRKDSLKDFKIDI